MARRDLSTNQQVQLQPQPAQESIVSGIADIGLKLIDTAQQAKITENASKAQVALSGLDEQYRIKAEADPFDKGALNDYQTQRQELLTGFKDQISPLYRQQWDESANRLTTNSDTQLDAWRYKQTALNTTNSVKTAMENNFLQANKAGLSYGQGNDDVSHLMDFAVSQKELTDFASKNIGGASAQQLLKDYQKDYFKAYITGAAQGDPARANALLEKPEVSGLFDTQEHEELQDVMRKTVKQKSIDTLITQSGNESQATDIVNGSGDYFNKRLQIDKMELGGQISSDTAENARRVLRSTKAVTDLSHSDVMAGIITRMYDLNAVQQTDSEGYLTGVRNIRQNILASQADGELSPADASKLNKQVDQLSGQKLAAATQRVGVNFYDAKEKFNQLAPQYRGEAVRELFYRTQGQDLSDTQIMSHANKIVDEMKNRSRQNVVQKLKQFDNGTYPPPLENPLPGASRAPLEPPLSFDAGKFMKDSGIKQSDVTATAQKYGISEAEVIRRIHESKGKK